MEKEPKDLLQHLLNYWNIYEYVAAGEKSISEIKSYLLKEKHMSDTTTRRYINTITNDVPGMFLVGKNGIAINKVLVSDVIGEVLKDLEVASDEMSKVALEDKDKQITLLENELRKSNIELESILKELKSAHQTIRREEQTVNYWTCKNKKLVQNQIEQQLNREVVYAENLTIKPDPDIDEMIFLDDSIVKLDIEQSISKYGGTRESYYAIKEERDSSILNCENYFRRIAEKIMPQTFFKKWAQEIKDERKFKEKHKFAMKEPRSGTTRERNSSNGKNCEVRRHTEELLRRRKIAVQTIMNDDRLSDQMKLQMYARFGNYHGTELERLINFAADYGINAKWFIQVLEDSDETDNYENIRDYLRMFAKPSEYKKKIDFARELLDGVWNIQLEYEGKPTRFVLVPSREIDEIRERLQLPLSKFTSTDFDEDIRRLSAPNDENRPSNNEIARKLPDEEVSEIQEDKLVSQEVKSNLSSSLWENDSDQKLEELGIDEYEEME